MACLSPQLEEVCGGVVFFPAYMCVCVRAMHKHRQSLPHLEWGFHSG